MFELKPITASGIGAALEKAERYRLLNDPVAAESICLDVLEIQPDNQEALVSLLLARTDQFATSHGAGDAAAREVLPRLSSEYDREPIQVCNHASVDRLTEREQASLMR